MERIFPITSSYGVFLHYLPTKKSSGDSVLLRPVELQLAFLGLVSYSVFRLYTENSQEKRRQDFSRRLQERATLETHRAILYRGREHNSFINSSLFSELLKK